MKNIRKSSRRNFLTKLSLGTAALSMPNFINAKNSTDRKKILRPAGNYHTYSANDKIRLATIGFGIQGIGDTGNAVNINGVCL